MVSAQLSTVTNAETHSSDLWISIDKQASIIINVVVAGAVAGPAFIGLRENCWKDYLNWTEIVY